MELDFQTSHLRKLCEQSKFAQRELGPDSAKKLRSRLADIDAAAFVTSLVAGNPHPLKGNRKGQFAVWLAGGDRLVFVPNQDPIPTTDDGATDWSRVSKVKVVSIGDYHD